MSPKTEATVKDLRNVPENGKAELVRGELVLIPPSGGLPGLARMEITISLDEYSRRTRMGHAIPDNVGFLVDLPHRKSFSPDAAYFTGALSMGFLEGAPRFAVEVRREGDYGPAAEREMAEKRDDYFAAGTLVVWDVDLLSDNIVRSYRTDRPENPEVFRRGRIANAEPAVPGWTFAVDALFPADH
ncbi:Uma2 family endonuclease [Singulisphaera rosea]